MALLGGQKLQRGFLLNGATPGAGLHVLPRSHARRSPQLLRPVTAALIGSAGGKQRGAPGLIVPRAAAAEPTTVLPWQAAMDDVKKRRDLQKIMIIGAGPIVIGQVGGERSR